MTTEDQTTEDQIDDAALQLARQCLATWGAFGLPLEVIVRNMMGTALATMAYHQGAEAATQTAEAALTVIRRYDSIGETAGSA